MVEELHSSAEYLEDYTVSQTRRPLSYILESNHILCWESYEIHKFKMFNFSRRIEQYLASQSMQEQKRVAELKEREEQKAIFTEKISRQMYETEVRIHYRQSILCSALKKIENFQLQNIFFKFLILCSF